MSLVLTMIWTMLIIESFPTDMESYSKREREWEVATAQSWRNTDPNL